MQEREPDPSVQLSEAADFIVAGYRVDPAALRICTDGQVKRLEPRTLRLLFYLATHAGEVISRARLEQTIWEGRVVGDDALTNTIAKLRRAFADDARRPRVIETLPKTGYRLIAAVEWVDAETVATAARERVQKQLPHAQSLIQI